MSLPSSDGIVPLILLPAITVAKRQQKQQNKSYFVKSIITSEHIKYKTNDYIELTKRKII